MSTPSAKRMRKMQQHDEELKKKLPELEAIPKKYAPQIKSCYDERLGANPNLSGRIAVGVDISAGRVTTARIEENTTGDKDLETCVVKKVRGWRFPTEVTESGVYFPFSLSTG